MKRPSRRGSLYLAAGVLGVAALVLGLRALGTWLAPQLPAQRSFVSPIAEGDLEPNARYQTTGFSEPFEFTLPSVDAFCEDGAHAEAWGQGGLRIGCACCWDAFFLDDRPIATDFCDVTAEALDDIPATPDAVGDWLGQSSNLHLDGERRLNVDGRPAIRFDLTFAQGCRQFVPPLDPSEAIADRRIYAIPTGSDTILFLVWADQGSGRDLYDRGGADRWAQSILFAAVPAASP
jgi:hypothetical protein